MKPFLILQLRPETEASDGEYDAILEKGGLAGDDTVRIRLDQDAIPDDLKLDDYAGVIVGGGPGCVSDAENQKSETEKRIESSIFDLMPAIVESDFPYMGCCYGLGILTHHLKAPVNKQRYGEEVGAVECQMTNDGHTDPLLHGLPRKIHGICGPQGSRAGLARELRASPVIAPLPFPDDTLQIQCLCYPVSPRS